MSSEDISSHVIAASVTGIVLSTLAMAFRVWSRRIVNRSLFWWDDYLAALGWIFGLGDCALSLYWVQVGLGRHQEELGPGVIKSRALLPLFVHNLLYNVGITLVKLSLICFYARIFRDRPRLRVCLFVTATLAVAWYIAVTAVSICTCLPVRKQWDHHVEGHCRDRHGAFVATAVTNILIDLAILIIPIPSVRSLRMSKVHWLGVTSIFAMGYCFVVICIVRIIETARFQSHRSDFTWNWTLPQALAVTEIPLGIFGLCLPCILPLAKRYFSFEWRSTAVAEESKQNRASRSLPHSRLRELKTGGSESRESVTEFVTTLGRGSGVVTSTYASRDSNEGSQLVGREEIQVRVDISVDFDVAPGGTMHADPT